VTELLDEIGFLWQPMFSAGRCALVAEISGAEGRRVVVAGRAAFERRLLALGSDRSVLEGLVAQQDARSLWLGCGGGGSWAAPAESRLDRGRRLHFRGRWQESLDAVAGMREPSAQILRADCLRRLGRLALARRVLESLSAEQILSAGPSLDYTDVAVSLYLDLGNRPLAMSLLEQQQLGAPRRYRMGFNLLATEVAARCGEWEVVS